MPHVNNTCSSVSGRANMETPKQYYILKEVEPPSNKPYYIAIAVAAVLCIIGLILVITGGAMLSKTKDCESTPDEESKWTPCDYSSEAQRVKLDKFLRKVKITYYKMNPNNLVHDPDSTPDIIRQDSSPYNAHPDAIRTRTDAAQALYREAQELDKKSDSAKMKPREVKAIAQVKHFLQSNFGTPYDENYYAGDWMLGPNKFCWQPICEVGNDIKSHFTHKKSGIRPKTVGDINFVIDHLRRLNNSLMQYIENVKYGVKAGFVRPEEDCQDGLYSIQRTFFNVSQQGPLGMCMYY